MTIFNPQILGLGPPRLVSVFHLYITKSFSQLFGCSVLEHSQNTVTVYSTRHTRTALEHASNVLEHGQNTLAGNSIRHTKTVLEHTAHVWHATIKHTSILCNLLMDNIPALQAMGHATSRIRPSHPITRVACHTHNEQASLCFMDRIIFSTNAGDDRFLSV